MSFQNFYITKRVVCKKLCTAAAVIGQSEGQLQMQSSPQISAIEKELQYSTRYTKENAGKVGCGSDHLFG